MPWFDLPESGSPRPARTSTSEPDGLDAWWTARLAEANEQASETTLTRYKPEVYGDTEVYDVEFSGARGDRVRGWYVRPAGAGDGTHPVLVTYIGYGGRRTCP